MDGPPGLMPCPRHADVQARLSVPGIALYLLSQGEADAGNIRSSQVGNPDLSHVFADVRPGSKTGLRSAQSIWDGGS